MWWFDICIHGERSPLLQVNYSITYLFCGGETTLRFYFLTKIQWYHLQSRCYLYIRSSHLILLITQSLHPFINFFSPLPQPQHLETTFSTLFLWFWLPYPFFKDSTYYQEQTPCSTCNALQVHPHGCKMEDFLLSQG